MLSVQLFTPHLAIKILGSSFSYNKKQVSIKESFNSERQKAWMVPETSENGNTLDSLKEDNSVFGLQLRDR